MSITKKSIEDAFKICKSLDEMETTYQSLMKIQDDLYNAGKITARKLITVDGWTCYAYSKREEIFNL
jgi:hypothetical protein